MRPHPKNSETDSTAPRAYATCERCGFIWNLFRMQWQYEWRGVRLENTRHIVCPRCEDSPNRQLGTVFLTPDPVPVFNARPEQYYVEEQTYRVTQNGQIRYQMDGLPRLQSNLQSGSTPDQTLATEPYQQGVLTDSQQNILLDP
jgi:hypothetical protein